MHETTDGIARPRKSYFIPPLYCCITPPLHFLYDHPHQQRAQPRVIHLTHLCIRDLSLGTRLLRRPSQKNVLRQRSLVNRAEHRAGAIPKGIKNVGPKPIFINFFGAGGQEKWKLLGVGGFWPKLIFQRSSYDLTLYIDENYMSQVLFSSVFKMKISSAEPCAL